MGKERFDVFERARADQRSEAWGMLALVLLFVLPLAAAAAFGVYGVLVFFTLVFAAIAVIWATRPL